MKKYTGKQMKELLTDKQWETFGMLMFDNCPIEKRQEAFSLYLQSIEKIKALKAIISDWESFRQSFDQISYHSEGMGCGIEDRGITDRYEACRHGWDKAMEKISESIPEEIDFEEAEKEIEKETPDA